MRSVVILILLLLPFFVAAQQVNNLEQELAKYEALNDPIGASRLHTKLAFTHWNQGNNREAIEHFEKSMQLNTQIGNKNAIASINSYLGIIYSDMGENGKALQYLQKALQMKKQFKDKKAIVSEHINIAVVYNQSQNEPKAIDQLEEALVLAKETNDIKLLRRVYGMLAENYQSLGNNEKSIQYYELFSALDKQIQQQYLASKEAEANKMVNEAELRQKLAETEKVMKEEALQKTSKDLDLAIQESKAHQLEIDLLNKDNKIKALEIKEQEARLRQEATIRYAFIAGIALVILIAILTYLAYRQKKKSNQLLAEQNDEINKQKNKIEFQSNELKKAFEQISDKNHKINRSITYASRIQSAMLSHWDKIQMFIPESFVFFKPRDIVSGDFYWFRELNNNSNKLALAAVDCTGHGIPGAFMSVIANEQLHEIVDLKHLESPELILSELHQGVREALKQSETNNKDGMDLAFCTIDMENKVLEYAGARNPLIYIKNNELNEIAGDRKSIGGFPNVDKKEFKKHQISLAEPTTFYIYSDGFQDQFGGEKGDKFMVEKFKQLLFKIHHLPIDEQVNQLEETFKQWKGNFPQVDDLLVIGFKIG
jgi:serine phosphatase RsbU (regulator of sigma subunit)